MTRRAPIGLLALLFLLPVACGDSEEQAELRRYSDWLDEMDARREEVLRPLEDLPRGDLARYVENIEAYVGSGMFRRMRDGAKAVEGTLARVRDDVAPAHASLVEEAKAYEVESERIRDLHMRLLAAMELDARVLASLGGMADLVEQLLALDVEDDPDVPSKVQAAVEGVSRSLQQCVQTFQSTGLLIQSAGREVDQGLAMPGQPPSPTQIEVARIVRDADGTARSLGSQLDGLDPRNPGPGLRALAGAVEKSMIPAYRKMVEKARDLAIPEELRERWGSVRDGLQRRLEALGRFLEIRDGLDRMEALDASPAGRAGQLGFRIRTAFQIAMRDRAQAEAEHRMRIEKVRQLRGEML